MRVRPRVVISSLVAALALLTWQAGPLRSAQDHQLSGRDVALISRAFLDNHFSREQFDHDRAMAMLDNVLNQYDPEHLYFLQPDIQEFQRDAGHLEDTLARGEVTLAFRIYQRFLERAAELERQVLALEQEPLTLQGNETMRVNRRDAPYPADPAEQREILRKRVKLELLQQTQSGIAMAEAKEDLSRRYRNVRLRMEQYNNNDVLSSYLNAFTKSFDPHSRYMTQEDLENFNIDMRLSLEGIGATLRWEDGYTIINTIIPGGAAAREGTLRPEDKIIAVAQGKGAFEDVRNMRLSDVVRLIRGERGTTVRLAFLRKVEGVVEKRLETAIVRDKIELKESEASAELHTLQSEAMDKPLRLGVIKLPTFYVDFAGRNSFNSEYKSASRDVAGLLAQFIEQKVDGMVLDLRNNPGGGLDEAVAVAGLFLDRGPVVMVKTARGRITYHTNPRKEAMYKGPLVVLTSRYSASASEIVAGALKDYGRAVIVGESSTFGKGTVQNVIGLPGKLGALKTTVAKFYRPGSSSTQNLGVRSDIVLPSINNHLDIGEASQPNAMPWDAVQPARFHRWAQLDPVLPLLRALTEERQRSNPKFQAVMADVEDYVRHRKGRETVRLSEVLDEEKPPAPRPANGMHGEDAPPEDDVVLQEGLRILTDFIQITARQQTQGRLANQ